MSQFDEVRFSTEISLNASSRPRRNVDVVELKSGYRVRNARWKGSLRFYDVSFGVRCIDDIYEILEFWEARGGPERGFRFKDWADYKSSGPNDSTTASDQSLKEIDPETFQAVKRYTSAGEYWEREITKLVAGTIKVKDDNGPLVKGTDYTLDENTGIVTFTIDDPQGPGTIPPTNPTAGFEFDVPVGFQDNELEVNVSACFLARIPEIGLVELRS